MYVAVPYLCLWLSCALLSSVEGQRKPLLPQPIHGRSPTPDDPCAGAQDWFEEDLKLLQSTSIWEVAKSNDQGTILKTSLPGDHAQYPMWRYSLTNLSASLDFVRTVEGPGYSNFSANWVPQTVHAMNVPLGDKVNVTFDPVVMYAIYHFPFPFHNHDICQITCTRQLDNRTWQSSTRTVDPSVLCAAAKPEAGFKHLYEHLTRLFVQTGPHTVEYTMADQEDASFPADIRELALAAYPGQFLSESVLERKWIEANSP